MKITRTSMISGIERTRDIPCTEQQYSLYEKGAKIQVAMPDVSASDREFILSGIVDDEWDMVFPEDEEDEELRWVLCTNSDVLDTCIASSKDEAIELFKEHGAYDNWEECDVLSMFDYMSEMELRAFEAENF